MKITDLLRQRAVTSQSGKTGAEASEKNEQAERAARSGDDKVSISSQAKQFAQISRIVDEDTQAQATKVADIKRAVESGEYAVPTKDTAQAMSNYLKGA